MTIRSWSRGGVIGKGGYGTVFVCINNENGQLFSMKEIQCAAAAAAPEDPLNGGGGGGVAYGCDATELENEIQVLSTLSHRHIVRYLGCRRDGQKINIFMEYVAGGSLAEILKNFRRLEEPVAQLYTRQLLLGLEYLHNAGYVHRDVKASNILIAVDGTVKLSDFGTALKLQHGACTVQAEGKCIGTLQYIAPERMKSGLIGSKADIYATGCVLLEMLAGALPAPQHSNALAMAYAHVVPTIPASVSCAARAFLHLCFAEYAVRPSATTLLRNVFLAQSSSTQPTTQATMADGGETPAPLQSPQSPEELYQRPQQNERNDMWGQTVPPPTFCNDGGGGANVTGMGLMPAVVHNALLQVPQRYKNVTVSQDLSSMGASTMEQQQQQQFAALGMYSGSQKGGSAPNSNQASRQTTSAVAINTPIYWQQQQQQEMDMSLMMVGTQPTALIMRQPLGLSKMTNEAIGDEKTVYAAIVEVSRTMLMQVCPWLRRGSVQSKQIDTADGKPLHEEGVVLILLRGLLVLSLIALTTCVVVGHLRNEWFATLFGFGNRMNVAAPSQPPLPAARHLLYYALEQQHEFHEQPRTDFADLAGVRATPLSYYVEGVGLLLFLAVLIVYAIFLYATNRLCPSSGRFWGTFTRWFSSNPGPASARRVPAAEMQLLLAASAAKTAKDKNGVDDDAPVSQRSLSFPSVQSCEQYHQILDFLRVRQRSWTLEPASVAPGGQVLSSGYNNVIF